MTAPGLPLDGILVLDVTRMLPGAVLVRHLVDLGARVVKVEDPLVGDPIRVTPPLVSGVGAGFCAFFRSVESVAFDLKSPEDAARFRALARRADVVVESFRPGTMERWGVGLAGLREACPRLVTCSLSSFGEGEPKRVAHDLNLSALSGALALAGGGVPRLQLADVTTGLLALCGILASLLERTRTGRGRHLDQPLAAGPLPLLVWAWAEASLGKGGVVDGVLSGRCPAYRIYDCADAPVSVAVLEPKFWAELLVALELPEWADAGLDTGERGAAAAEALAARFRGRPRAEWLALAAERGLPIAAVNDVRAAMREPFYARLSEATPLPGGGSLTAPASPLVPWAGARPLRAAPRLGEHTEAVLAELAS